MLNSKINKLTYNKFLFLLFFLIFLLIFFKNYSGSNKSVEIFLWEKHYGIAKYELDYFLNKTFFDKISIIYKLFGKLNINLSNDNIGFLVYIFFSFISAFFTFKIIKEHFDVDDKNEILIILIALAFSQSLFLIGNKSSWITNHAATQTFFSMSLKTLLIYSLLSKRIIALSFVSTLMLLIGIKSAWFVIGLSIVFSLISFKIKEYYWIIFPVITLIFLKIISPEIDTSNNKIFFENILLRDNLETAFHLQPSINIFLLIFSFPVYYYLIKKIEVKKDLKKFLELTLIFSFANFLFFYVYAKYGINIFPEPRILVLSGTRAMELYELFFSITLLCFIIKSKIKYFYKILLIFLYTHLVIKSFLASFAFLFASLFLLMFYLIIKLNMFLFSLLYEKNVFSFFTKPSKKFFIIIFLLSLLPSISYLTYIKITNEFSYYSYKKIGKWTLVKLNKDKSRIDNLIYLRSCDDFILLDLNYFPISNSISNKSSFGGGIHYNYFDKELILESKKRSKIIKNIKENINNKKQINTEDVNNLFDYEAFIILKNSEAKYFPKNINSFNFNNGEKLLIFSRRLDINNFCNL